MHAKHSVFNPLGALKKFCVDSASKGKVEELQLVENPDHESWNYGNRNLHFVFTTPGGKVVPYTNSVKYLGTSVKYLLSIFGRNR